MRKATFYLLNENNGNNRQADYERLACQLASQWWRKGKRILMACETQQQAERLDELLWSMDLNQFTPHNLAGEGPKQGAPVELCWPKCRGNASRDLLINLQSNFADFATTFYNVIDFVPDEEQLKHLARERYKAYRALGFQLETITATTY